MREILLDIGTQLFFIGGIAFANAGVLALCLVCRKAIHEAFK